MNGAIVSGYFCNREQTLQSFRREKSQEVLLRITENYIDFIHLI